MIATYRRQSDAAAAIQRMASGAGITMGRCRMRRDGWLIDQYGHKLGRILRHSANRWEIVALGHGLEQTGDQA